MKDIGEPVWSLDSKSIYFQAHDHCDLFRVRIRDGRLERITDLRDFATPAEAWFGVAPDGSALALQRNREQEIYSIDWIRP